MFEMTLREQLESDLSGDLKTFIVYTQMETQEFDAFRTRKYTIHVCDFNTSTNGHRVRKGEMQASWLCEKAYWPG